MTTEVRPIDRKMVEEFYGHAIHHPTAACGGFIDDRLVAVWGLTWYPTGTWVFWQCKDEALHFRVRIMKEARSLLEVARKIGETAVFSGGDDRDTSVRIHKRLGFVEVGEKDGMKVWKWSR